MQIEFESKLEWGTHLDEIYGGENWVGSDEINDDETYSYYYTTKDWTREFIYDHKTRIGEV